MSIKKKVNIFWFRRDLRLYDNHGLSQALSAGLPVLPIFIFDTDILEKLPSDDHRVQYIHTSLVQIHDELYALGGVGIRAYHARPEQAFQSLCDEYDVEAVYTNHDYEPYAKKRDAEIKTLLGKQGIELYTFKDQVIFEMSEVVKDDGTPYTVYTPYMKKWRSLFRPDTHAAAHTLAKENFLDGTPFPLLSLSDIGFKASAIMPPEAVLDTNLVNNYSEARDFPALAGTSRMSTRLRFGTVSIRELVRMALISEDDTYLKELIWREFFMQILWHFPHTKDQAFKPAYDYIPWRNDVDEFEKWKKGETGFPMVDAGMRELNQTGYMHNRVRMVVASFLCKHLLIDWRWGEAYFAEKLFDYDRAQNIGNWQWASGSGVDAAPYFRVFNPEIQFKKFDPDGEYVRTWVPEYFGFGYVPPMVEHAEARDRAVETYQIALKEHKEN
jgi:deoxyribodipyrimidine photo-lyase